MKKLKTIDALCEALRLLHESSPELSTIELLRLLAATIESVVESELNNK